MSDFYNPNAEISIAWNYLDLDAIWPIQKGMSILSNKNSNTYILSKFQGVLS